jgi:hypothetical protein
MNARACGAGVVLALALMALTACGPVERFWYYRVDRTNIEECSIRPDGEFCKSEDQFQPDTNEGWSLHIDGTETTLFIDETAWRLDPLADDADPLTADRAGKRLVKESREPGPCTTTTEQLVRLSVTQERIAGDLRSRRVVEGPEACGATPSGDRIVQDITGLADGVP